MAFPFAEAQPSARLAWGTWTLIILCLGIFAFAQPSTMQWSPGSGSSMSEVVEMHRVAAFQDRWGLVPCEVSHGRHAEECDLAPAWFVGDGRLPGRFGSLVTAQFLHVDVLHLLGNLLFLWVFGRGLEERVGAAGVIGVFVAGGIAAFLGYVLVTPDSTVPVLGASGAVAAIMGAYLVVQPRRRVLSVVYAAGLQVLYLPAWAVLSFFVASQFFITPEAQVAWQAHLAGIGFGIAVGLAWVVVDPSLRPPPTAADPSVAPTGSAPEPGGPGADRGLPGIVAEPPAISRFPVVGPENRPPRPGPPDAPGHR